MLLNLLATCTNYSYCLITRMYQSNLFIHIIYKLYMTALLESFLSIDFMVLCKRK